MRRCPSAEKLAHLDALEADLLGRGDGRNAVATRLRAALEERKLTPRHAQDLLTAFRMDVTKLRYRELGRPDRLLQPLRDAGRPLRARRARRGRARPGPRMTRCARRCRSTTTCRTVARTSRVSTVSISRSMRWPPPARGSRSSAPRDPRRRCSTASRDSPGAPPRCSRRASAISPSIRDSRLALEVAVITRYGAAHRRPAARARSAERERAPRQARHDGRRCSPASPAGSLARIGAAAPCRPTHRGARERGSRGNVAECRPARPAARSTRRCASCRKRPARGDVRDLRFCRQVDDIADSPGPPRRAPRGARRWRADIDALYQGRPTPLTSDLARSRCVTSGWRRPTSSL